MKIEKRGIIEKIINISLNVFIVIFSIILLISLYNNVQVKLLGKDYSDFFGYSIFEVQTGSMAPEINPGDWIIVKSTKNISLKDVVTYNQDGEYITHRVIGAYNNTYVTKGDANNSKDNPIDRKQIVGKVVKILPNFGIFRKTIFNPAVLVSIIITILICDLAFKKNKKQVKGKVDRKSIKFSDNIVKKIKEVKLKSENIKNQEEIEVKEDYNEPEEKANEIIDVVIEDVSAIIPVDASELDETFLQIAQNEIEEEVVVQNKIKVLEEIKEEIIDKPTKINLELLENGKKSKNVIKKFISVKIEELNEILNVLDNDGKNYVNEITIKNKLMSSYIEARYYNYYGSVDVKSTKKQSIKIEGYLQEVSELMKKSYKGSDAKYCEKVDRFLNIFITIANLEQALMSITDKKAKEEFYKKELIKYSKESGWNNLKIKNAISDINKIQRNYIGIIEYLLKKIDTNMFNLEFNKLKSDKNMYALNLEHHITFGKVYSDYIIDKTYNEGVVAENKIIVLLNLLSTRLIKDMINCDFNKKYITYLPNTLYSKEKKLTKVLGMIEDEYAKENVLILINFNDLIKHKTIVKKLKKEGYNFCMALTNGQNIDSKNFGLMSLVNYIFVDKKIPNIIKILSILPEEVVDKIIYEDITEKIGDFGGER